MSYLKLREQSIGSIKPNPKLLGLAIIEISPTDLCTRTCSFCPRHNPETYPNKNLHMTVDTAKLLREQLIVSSFTGLISLAGYGEPLLNSNIKHIIKELNVFNIELITNADPILKQKFTIAELLDCGVSSILISDYDNNPALTTLTEPYKNVIVRHYTDDGKDHLKEYSFSNRAGLVKSLDKPIQRPCYIPSYKAIIDWNGDVLLCSNDWRKNTVFGNIHSNNISAIWMSDAFANIRRELYLGNRSKFSSCSKCDVLGDIMGKNYAEYWV